MARVQQTAQDLAVATRLGAEDGVRLVHQQGGRDLADRAEDDRRRGVHRHHRVVDRLVEHVQHAGLAASLGRTYHRQAGRVLQSGLDVRGRHPQSDRGQRLLAGQHHVLADRRPQLIQQRGTVTGCLDAGTFNGPRCPIPHRGPRRCAARSPPRDRRSPATAADQAHGPRCGPLVQRPHLGERSPFSRRCPARFQRTWRSGPRLSGTGHIAGTVPRRRVSGTLVPARFHARRSLRTFRCRGLCIRLVPATLGDALAGDCGRGPDRGGCVRGVGGHRVLHRRSSLARGRTG